MLRQSLKWIVFTFLLITAIIAVFAVFSKSFWPEPNNTEAPFPVADVPAPTPAATTSPSPAPAPVSTDTPSPAPTPLSDEARIQAYIRSMGINEKLGQLVLFGFSGTSSPSSSYQKIFDEYAVGNYMLYGANVQPDDDDGGFSRTARLTATLRRQIRCDIAPFIGIDVEGGEVVRFTFDQRPLSAKSLGDIGDEVLAREQFESIGLALLDCGVNLDLSPVLDIAKEPMRTFLTTRIISRDAGTASRIGAAMIDGLHRAGCLSVGKHFPGHGATNADSHQTTPVVNASLEAMLGYELIPFSAGIAAGVDMMLVAHIAYPQLDGNDIASMSHTIISVLLREQMGFSGVVMSDDFRMGGLTGRYETGEAAVRFIKAGGDLILCGAKSEYQLLIMQALHSAAADGRLDEARIDESVYRILLLKFRSGLWSPQPMI